MKRRLALVASLTALAAAGFAMPSTAAIVVRGDVQIGRFHVKRDGTLHGAIRAFGKPTSVRRGRYQDCVARWRPIRLRISFYNLGGKDPCKPQWGYFSSALMTGNHWQTARGLRIGEPSRRMFALYAPRVWFLAGGWWSILRRHSPFGDGGLYGALNVKLLRGWVVAFRVVYPAGGD